MKLLHPVILALVVVPHTLACRPPAPPLPDAGARVPALQPVVDRRSAPHVPIETRDHFTVVPGRAGAIPARFILDTGIGVTLVSADLCKRAGCTPGGEFTGRRMSGQAVTVPLATLGSLAVGPHRLEAAPVGVVSEELLGPGIDGILSLGVFATTSITVDYPHERLVFEDAASLAGRARAGTAVPVTVDRDGPSLTLFLTMDVPGGPAAKLLVDTGSDSLILDERFMPRLGVDPAGPEVKRVEGKDETGNGYVRFFSPIAGTVHPAGAPGLAQERPRVMFQRIIHDGLVGRSFLSRFVVTYDIPGSRMILGPAAAPAAAR